MSSDEDEFAPLDAKRERNRRRKRGYDVYGVFGGGSSDDAASDSPATKRARRSEPIAFVAAETLAPDAPTSSVPVPGTTQSSSAPGAAASAPPRGLSSMFAPARHADDDKDDDDDDASAPAGAAGRDTGRGNKGVSGGGGGGLGYGNASRGTGHSTMSVGGGSGGGLGYGNAGVAGVSNTTLRAHDLPTQFAAPSRHRGSRRRGPGGAHTESERNVAKQLDVQIDAFKYNTGFGWKMMQKMGLGKDPSVKLGKVIEVTARPGKQGLGAGRNENKSDAEDDGDDDGDSGSDGDLSMRDAAPLPAPRESGRWRRRRARRAAEDPEIVVVGAPDTSAAAAATPVIDMRSGVPVVQAATSAAHAGVLQARLSSGPLKELRYNTAMLVHVIEGEVKAKLSLVEQEKRARVQATEEEGRLARRVSAEEKHVEQMQALLPAVAGCRDAAKVGGIDAVLAAVTELLQQFPQQWWLHDLARIVPPVLLPLLKRHLRHWDPLTQPRWLAGVLVPWKALLDEPEAPPGVPKAHRSVPRQVYDTLLVQLLVPAIRRALTNAWQPRQPDAAVALVEALVTVAPWYIARHVLHHTVLPVLQREVDAWNPLEDAVGIDRWLHPWLPLLGDDAMQPLWPTVRQRLQRVLRNWKASDDSALAVLEPWTDVFDPTDMAKLVNTSIVPQLAQSLRLWSSESAQLQLSAPEDDAPTPLRHALAWSSVIPRPVLLAILETEFFPFWLSALYHRIRSGPPVSRDIAAWYRSWRRELATTATVWTSRRVRRYLLAALVLMQRARRGDGLDVPPPPPLPLAWYLKRQPGAAAATAAATRSAAGVGVADLSVSFRDVVELAAARVGLTFLPSDRKHESHQVWCFGPCSIYIDAGVVYLAPEWKPVSVGELVAMATTTTSSSSS